MYEPTSNQSIWIFKEDVFTDFIHFSEFKREDLEQFSKAFPTHSKKIIDTYDGSSIVTDTNQTLVGEEYYAKQIAEIKERNKTSFLTKWNHLLYQGDETYVPSIATPLPHINFATAPTMSRTFSLSSTKPTGQKTISTTHKPSSSKSSKK